MHNQIRAILGHVQLLHAAHDISCYQSPPETLELWGEIRTHETCKHNEELERKCPPAHGTMEQKLGQVRLNFCFVVVLL